MAIDGAEVSKPVVPGDSPTTLTATVMKHKAHLEAAG